MPSSHTPIKKYNYERSLFRWVVSRHPEPFEKHGITTKTLERAPLAREAFYTSDWPGAQALVHCNSEYKYERTPFFDRIIERGLRDGTRFNVDHVTSDEKCSLGITMDRATGKYYLHAFGSTRARRNPTRRGSATSSEGESDNQHVVIKDLGDLLASEIEAAGENPDVRLSKSRLKPGSCPGSTVLNFSVLIQRRDVADAAAAAGGSDGGGGGLSMAPTGGGAEEAWMTATADAGGGNPTGCAPRQQQRGRSGPTSNKRPQQQQQQQQCRNEPTLNKRPQQQQRQQQQQQHRRQGSEKCDSAVSVAAAAAALASVSQGGAKKLHKAKGRPRPSSISSSPPGAGIATGSGTASSRDAAGGAGEPPKRRKSIAKAVFPTSNSPATSSVKREPAQQLSVYAPSSTGGLSGMGANFRPPSSTGSGNSTSGSKNRTAAHLRPMTVFGGLGSRSFLPGMGVMPQPLQHSFPSAVASSSSSSSSSAPNSPSQQQRYGAGAGATPVGAVQQRSPPDWNFATGWNGNNYAARRVAVATGSSGASAEAPPTGGDADGGVVTVSATPQAGTSSWSYYQMAGIRGGEFGSEQDQAGASGGSIKGGAEAGGGGDPLPSLSQRFGGEMATLLDDHTSSQSHGGTLGSTLKPCTPYTKQQQSLAQQVATGGGAGIVGSTHGGWGGAVGRTGGAAPSCLASFSSTEEVCNTTANDDDKELDFLEVFF
ncbi:unnamed protein product [Pylaiella littoralis]